MDAVSPTPQDRTPVGPGGKGIFFMPTLETVGLSKIFRKRGGGHVEALLDINTRSRAREFVSIVGASGCGKTTFLRIVDGLLEPSAGKVLLDGREVTKPGPDRGF